MITMPMAIYFLIVSSYFGPYPWWHYPLACILTFVLFFLIAIVIERVSKREKLGGGAIKLMAAVGAALGIVTVSKVAAISLIVVMSVLASIRLAIIKTGRVPSSPIVLFSVISVLIYNYACQ
jgi:prepilin signal peptidase PulO-like enzyme (type II secretory pathway)